jgi:hypothetical protein
MLSRQQPQVRPAGRRPGSAPRPGSPAPRARLDARPGAIVSRAHRVRDRRGLSRKSTASASATCCSMVNGPSVTDGATPRWV